MKLNTCRTQMNQNIEKKAKLCAIVWTVIYALLFLFLSDITLLSFMAFGSPHFSFQKGLFLVFTMSLLPFSLPLSIDLMWSSYVCGEYRKTLRFWLVPWLTLVFVLAVGFIVEFLLV